jgi:hypothetical protein
MVHSIMSMSEAIERMSGEQVLSHEDKHNHDSRCALGGEDGLSRRFAHTSSVAAITRSLMLPKLSNAGRTSREKTGLPSGSGGAE